MAIQKEAAELRNTLREVEKARLDARRELQELRRQVCAAATTSVCLFILMDTYFYFPYFFDRSRCLMERGTS